MGIDPELEKAIKEKTGPLIGSLAAQTLVAAASAVLMYVGINMSTKTMAGDTNMRATENETTASKVDASASSTEAAVSKDEVKAQDGDLSATQTEAAASTAEATALEGGATAARTKAGAADVETKALKMT